MSDWRRHAIYFAPPPWEGLARFGAAWLGWDPARGQAVEGPEVPGLPMERDALVAQPRRYGLHATLKPPFRLAEGHDAAELDAALAALAAGVAPFAVQLRLDWLGDFFALVPDGPSPELDRLAAACVIGLDRFRAPAGADPLARRHTAGLDAIEEANLAAWGYPYVLDRFRFHMTLTGPVPAAARAGVAAALGPVVAPLIAGPVAIADVCRFAEGEDRCFRLISRHRLG